MTLKHFLKRQNRSKIKFGKITVKSRHDVKSACFFYMFYVISQPCLKISSWNFVHLFISHCPLRYCTVLLLLKNFDFGGEIFEKEKKSLKIYIFYFQNFQNTRQQFCNPTNSTSFHIKQLIVALKTAPVAAIPVNPLFSVEIGGTWRHSDVICGGTMIPWTLQF